MSHIHMFSARPQGDRVEGESPLHHGGLERLAGQGHGDAGVRLRERQLLGHLLLRGDSAAPGFATGVAAATGLELPGALRISGAGERSLQWLGPDEWLLIVPGEETFETERRLRSALDGRHISVVDVSGGQTLLELSGPGVVGVLMKSTPVDVDPGHFPVGKAVGSVFAKSQCLIRRSGPQRWELVVRRSFADYFWLWLQDASSEYGLAIDR